MHIEKLNMSELTFDQVMADQGELYFLYFNGKRQATLTPVNSGKLDYLSDIYDKTLVRITDEPVEKDIPEVESAPSVKERKTYERRTYKLDSWDEQKVIEVESKIDGSIRINFHDKDSAEIYFNHIRDMFYKRPNLGDEADWLSVSTIYKELKVVNWEASDCDDWAWPRLDYGTCRYISEVNKTKNKHMWGFTLRAPQKLYGTKA